MIKEINKIYDFLDEKHSPSSAKMQLWQERKDSCAHIENELKKMMIIK